MRKVRGVRYAAWWTRGYAPTFLFFGFWFRFQLCFLVVFGLYIYLFLCLVRMMEGRKEGEGNYAAGHVVMHPPSLSVASGAVSSGVSGFWSFGPSGPVWAGPG